MPNQNFAPMDDSAWAITETGLAQYQTLMQQEVKQLDIGALTAAAQNPRDTDEDDDPSPLLSYHNSVGIISVKGPIISNDSFMSKLFGLVSYEGIRKALIEAVADSRVQHILLDVDSPGGMVNGVDDIANLITTVDQNIKPIYAHTDGQMASGAYWLASAARFIQASRVASIGSIGVIVNQQEVSRQLNERGITVNVIRAGKYKQMGNPYEPLSEEGRKELQDSVDGLYQIFVSQVSQARSRPYEYVDSHMAQGRMFLANDALRVGLIDHVGNFESILTKLSSKKVDTSQISFENTAKGVNTIMAKKTLTAEVQAALIAAGHLDADSPQTSVTATHAQVPEASAPDSQVQVGEPDAQVDADSDAELDTALPAVDAVPEGSDSANVESNNFEEKLGQLTAEVSVLRTQVQGRDEALVDARVQTRGLEQKLEKMTKAAEGLKAIAVRSVNAMQVALGSTATDFDEASVQTILSEHARLSESFTKNFKVGGVAAVAPNTEDTPQNSARDSQRAARIAATRL